MTQTASPRHEIVLRSGTLHLEIANAELPLQQLCGFASRRSRKRGFVFVSKVLGKHVPVRPSSMENIHRRLAERIAGVDRRKAPAETAQGSSLEGPILVIAMAETATALGQGVYEQLWKMTGRDDLLFMHSTRYRLRRRRALQFDENHSHATEHILYEPAEPEHRRMFQQAATLILIDDEMTTGNTLANLALAYRSSYPRLQALHLVCITDWLAAERKHSLVAKVGVPCRFHSLIRGSYTFEANPDFSPGAIPNVNGNGRFKDSYLPEKSPRTGCHGLIEMTPRIMNQVGMIRAGERVLVLGSGEFAYPPYCLARELEKQGVDVHYQSTTRSPLLPERDLRSVIVFRDNYHDNIPNYVYNVADRQYDRIVIGYETRPLPPGIGLKELIGGEEIYF